MTTYKKYKINNSHFRINKISTGREERFIELEKATGKIFWVRIFEKETDQYKKIGSVNIINKEFTAEKILEVYNYINSEKSIFKDHPYAMTI